MPRKYSRRRRSRSSKRTTKKKSMRRPKSKKIRGGVTVRAQDLKRLPEDVFGEIREMHPLLTPKLTNVTLIHAVKDYLKGNSRSRMHVVHKYGEINNWDVSKVKKMEWMFKGASSFNQPLNKWNVSNVTNMDSMFADAEAFNQPLNKWNVSNVEDMLSMFQNCEDFNQPLNNWNVSNVEDMENMFQNARSFNQPLHAPWYHEDSESE